MQITTIEVDREKAKEKYQTYRDALKERHDEQTETLKKAFYHVSQGRKLIDLNRVAEKTGLDGKGLPKIAICRAGQEFVYYRRISGGNPPQFTTKVSSWGWQDFQSRYWGVQLSVTLDWPKTERTAKAQVPIVPPEYMPNGALSRYHILFEPEWKPIPPVDPILLRHLGGSLYVVLAQWDLTDIERAVMAEAFE